MDQYSASPSTNQSGGNESGVLPVVVQHPVDLAVHEHMDQLVVDHVAECPHGAVRGDDNAALEKLEEPPDAFGDEPADGVGLLKVEVGTVEDERDATAERVVELQLQSPVARLGEGGSALGKRAHLRVVIDIEVLGLEHMPLEIGVLDLVAPEGVELGRGCPRQKDNKQGEKK